MRLTIVLAVVVAACLAGPAVVNAMDADDLTVVDAAGSDAERTADHCSMMMSWSALVASGFVGEQTPEAALAAFMVGPSHAVGFTPPTGAPHLARDDGTGAVFEWRNEVGDVVATIGLFSEGNGWIVNAGSSCAS